MGTDGVAHAAKLRGRRVRIYSRGLSSIAVDGSCILYPAQLNAEKAALSVEETAALVLRRLRPLQEGGCFVVLVMDGGLAMAKVAERQRRAADTWKAGRDADRVDESGAPLMVDGAPANDGGAASSVEGAANTAAGGSNNGFVRDVHGALHEAVLRRLAEAGISFVVAPFESDHQLAYLHYRRLVECVLTNDGDLAVLLAALMRGGKLLLDYDFMRGTAVEVDVDRLFAEGELDRDNPVLRLLAGKDWRALLMYACVANTDFHQLEGIGAATAAEIVRAVWQEFDMKATSTPAHLELLSLPVLDSLSRHSHTAHVKFMVRPRKDGKSISPRTRDSIYAGVRLAHLVFTRSIVYDPYEQRELQLAGPGGLPLTDEELAIIGRPLTSLDEPALCANGILRRDWRTEAVVNARGRELPLITVEEPPSITTVIHKGCCRPEVVSYGMCPAQCKAIFELPDDVIDAVLTTGAELCGGNDVDWPSSAVRPVLLTFFKCIGVKDVSDLGVGALRHRACLWLRLYRRVPPAAGGASNEDGDLLSALADWDEHFVFPDVQLRLPDGSSALQVMLRANKLAAMEAVPATGPSANASRSVFRFLPPGLHTHFYLGLSAPAASAGGPSPAPPQESWVGLSRWGADPAADGNPPCISLSHIFSFYDYHSRSMGFAAGSSDNVTPEMVQRMRPVQRALRRLIDPLTQPQVWFSRPVRLPDSTWVVFACGYMQASFRRPVRHPCRAAFRVLPVPVLAPEMDSGSSSHLPAPVLAPEVDSGSDDQRAFSLLRWHVDRITNAECPGPECKNNFACAHLAHLFLHFTLWNVHHGVNTRDAPLVGRAASTAWWTLPGAAEPGGVRETVLLPARLHYWVSNVVGPARREIDSSRPYYNPLPAGMRYNSSRASPPAARLQMFAHMSAALMAHSRGAGALHHVPATVNLHETTRARGQVAARAAELFAGASAAEGEQSGHTKSRHRSRSIPHARPASRAAQASTKPVVVGVAKPEEVARPLPKAQKQSTANFSTAAAAAQDPQVLMQASSARASPLNRIAHHAVGRAPSPPLRQTPPRASCQTSPDKPASSPSAHANMPSPRSPPTKPTDAPPPPPRRTPGMPVLPAAPADVTIGASAEDARASRRMGREARRLLGEGLQLEALSMAQIERECEALGGDWKKLKLRKLFDIRGDDVQRIRGHGGLSSASFMSGGSINYYIASLCADFNAKTDHGLAMLITTDSYANLTGLTSAVVPQFDTAEDLGRRILYPTETRWLFFPINEHNRNLHWQLLVFDLFAREVRFHCSLKHESSTALGIARAMVRGMFGAEGAQAWRFFASTVPQQLNGIDCGPFVCRFVKHILYDLPLHWADGSMGSSTRAADDFREEILAVLLAQPREVMYTSKVHAPALAQQAAIHIDTSPRISD